MLSGDFGFTTQDAGSLISTEAVPCIGRLSDQEEPSLSKPSLSLRRCQHIYLPGSPVKICVSPSI